VSERARRRTDRPRRREQADATHERILPAADAVSTTSPLGEAEHVLIQVP